jgi:hypothetical protein
MKFIYLLFYTIINFLCVSSLTFSDSLARLDEALSLSIDSELQGQQDNYYSSLESQLDNIDNFQDIEAEFKEEDLNSNK